MDLTTILDGKLDKDFLVQLFQEQEEVYKNAIQFSLINQNPLVWKAAWILKHCTSKNDARILPYVDDFITSLTNQNDGYQREVLNILSKLKLHEEQEGKLFDCCMQIWENTTKTSGVRYIAFKHIYNICTKHPELIKELTFLCQEQYTEPLSPGIKKGVYKLVKKI